MEPATICGPSKPVLNEQRTEYERPGMNRMTVALWTQMHPSPYMSGEWRGPTAGEEPGWIPHIRSASANWKVGCIFLRPDTGKQKARECTSVQSAWHWSAARRSQAENLAVALGVARDPDDLRQASRIALLEKKY